MKEYSDDIYDINKHCEERLSYYLEKSEDFKEAQINMIAQYVRIILVSETINISGDTFEVNLSGHCDGGEWKMTDAGNQLIAVLPKSVR